MSIPTYGEVMVFEWEREWIVEGLILRAWLVREEVRKMSCDHSMAFDATKIPGINSYISLQIRLFKEEGEYVAICDDLGLASCGSGLEEAKKRINNAITLVLNAATQNGEIEAFLMGKGIKVGNGIDTAPELG